LAKWKQDIIAAIFILAFLAAMFVDGIDLQPNARTYPFVLIILCAVFTLALLAKGIIGKNKEAKIQSDASFEIKLMEAMESMEEKLTVEEKKQVAKQSTISIMICCAIIYTYIMSINYLGYLISSFLFILGMLIFLRIRKWWLLILFSSGISYLIFFMFNNILLIPLPTFSLF